MYLDVEYGFWFAIICVLFLQLSTEGILNFEACLKNLEIFPIFLLYPFLFALSPFILIFMKIQDVLKPKSQLVEAQRMHTSKGVSFIKASPKLCLQVYIIISRINEPISWLVFLTKIISALALSLPDIEQFLLHRAMEKSILNYAKYGTVFISNNLFRSFSLAFIVVLLPPELRVKLAIVFLSFIILLTLVNTFYDDYPIAWIKPVSFFTISNLKKTESDIQLRKCFFYLSLFGNLVGLVLVLHWFKQDPCYFIQDMQSWTEENAMKLIFNIEFTIWLIILLGLLSLIIDFLLKDRSVFHEKLIISSFYLKNEKPKLK